MFFEASYMDEVIEILKIIIPAGLVLYGMFITVKSFLNREIERKVLDIRTKNSETVLPNRLQAYERMCLFLERISPNNLIRRLNDSSYNARQFQQVMVVEIREEFNHNLAQQVYVSDEIWHLTRNAMEDVILTINQAAEGLQKDARGIDLARKIFDLHMQKEQDATSQAIVALKSEVREYFE